jgi:hypothetical protein
MCSGRADFCAMLALHSVLLSSVRLMPLPVSLQGLCFRRGPLVFQADDSADSRSGG